MSSESPIDSGPARPTSESVNATASADPARVREGSRRSFIEFCLALRLSRETRSLSSSFAAPKRVFDQETPPSSPQRTGLGATSFARDPAMPAIARTSRHERRRADREIRALGFMKIPRKSKRAHDFKLHGICLLL